METGVILFRLSEDRWDSEELFVSFLWCVGENPQKTKGGPQGFQDPVKNSPDFEMGENII